MDNVPMLVLGCGIRRDTGMAFQLHDVDQLSMVEPVTKATFLPETGPALYQAVLDACRIAREPPGGPVFVEVPANLYLFRYAVEIPDPIPGTEAAEPMGPEPDRHQVARAAELVRAARRPLLYVGAGTRQAGAAVLDLAEALEAPVSTTFQGTGVFPESHPLFLWPGFGSAAPPFVQGLAQECDLTLALGCRFSEVGTGSYGLAPVGPLVHVDADPSVPGRNFPAEVAVTGDVRLFLEALARDLGDHRADRDEALRERIRKGHAEVWEGWLDDVGGPGVTPAHLIRTAQRLYGPDTIFTTDSGNGTFLAMECLRLEEPGKFLAPVDYSCMGYAVPAALGARLARPDCPVVALAGDGAFLMTGLETLTGVREGLGVVILVLRDHELAQIAQFQSVALNRKVASELPDFEVEGIARATGAAFIGLASDDRVEEVLTQADLEARKGRPVLVDVAIDYSRKTYFTRGVVKANLTRLPLSDRVRFIGRALARKVTG
jgi:acetolactate synthase-1/2/3 large subunit